MGFGGGVTIVGVVKIANGSSTGAGWLGGSRSSSPNPVGSGAGDGSISSSRPPGLD